jgi:hypothetical protein
MKQKTPPEPTAAQRVRRPSHCLSARWTARGLTLRLYHPGGQFRRASERAGLRSDNLKDTTAGLPADTGNGNCTNLDRLSEARRALVTQLEGNLTTTAKDVKNGVKLTPRRPPTP